MEDDGMAGQYHIPHFQFRRTKPPSASRLSLGLKLVAVHARKLLIAMAILVLLAGLAAFRTQLNESFVHTLARLGNAYEIYGRGPTW
jgi:hypothetical protein